MHAKQDVPLHSLKRTISLLSKSETQTGHSTKEELGFPEVAINFTGWGASCYNKMRRRKFW